MKDLERMINEELRIKQLKQEALKIKTEYEQRNITKNLARNITIQKWMNVSYSCIRIFRGKKRNLSILAMNAKLKC